LKAAAALDLDAKAPGAQLARSRLRACALGAPICEFRAAISAAFAADATDFIPAALGGTLAAALAECVASLTQE
jgi:hypothetical protein